MSDSNISINSLFDFKIRVYYEDTDAGGIVYYANYLKFFERARTEFLRANGVHHQVMQQDHHCLWVVKACSTEYHASARLDDELNLKLQIKRLGGASIQFEQQVWCNQVLIASTDIVIVCVSTETMRSKAIPQVIRHKLASLAGQTAE